MTILIGHVDPRVKKNLSLGLDENSGLFTQWLTMMTMTDHCNQEGVDIHDEQHSDGTKHIIWEKTRYDMHVFFYRNKITFFILKCRFPNPGTKKEPRKKQTKKDIFAKLVVNLAPS